MKLRSPATRSADANGPDAILATPFVVWSDGIQPAANRAALMARKDSKSMHLQGLEDVNVRPLWRLTTALGRVRQGALEKKRC